jgi:hypothetical protein
MRCCTKATYRDIAEHDANHVRQSGKRLNGPSTRQAGYRPCPDSLMLTPATGDRVAADAGG